MSRDVGRNVLTTVPAHRLLRWLDRFSPNRVFEHDPVVDFGSIVAPSARTLVAERWRVRTARVTPTKPGAFVAV